MKSRSGYFGLLVGMFFAFGPVTANAQSAKTDSADSGKDRVRQLVSFLQYSLNTIGSRNTPAREKDIIITQSYTKFFRDADVQVEDDLDPDRSTVTNKDVQAYLKDVDFFFRKARFDFEIEDIEQMVNENGQVYYLVKMNRNLQGVTLDGDSVNRTIPRFIEVNYDEEDDDLKIVSFYTTKLSEREDLRNWWNELTFEWKYIFQQKYNLYDSVTYEQLKELVSMDSLDLSSNHYILDFEPLFKLDRLVYLDLSNTQIKDLSPLRINNKLKFLSLSNTAVENLDYLKYASDLEHLDLGSAKVADIGVLTDFRKLKYLNIGTCPIRAGAGIHLPVSLEQLVLSEVRLTGFDWLKSLINLKTLDLSFSSISDLGPLSGLSQLQTLLVEATGIGNLAPLSGIDQLEVLNIESTLVADLSPLSGSKSLRKVYCDDSQVSKTQADRFMKENPHILVIFDSDFLREWWSDLDPAWRNLFTAKFRLKETPEKDELARITQLDTLDLSGNKTILSLTGLEPLQNLVFLNINKTYVRDIGAAADLADLRELNAGFSSVENIGSLDKLKNLESLNVESTRISSLSNLSEIRGLKYLNIDKTRISNGEIIDFIKTNPGCLVIYRSNYLKRWWDDLSDEWKEIFLDNYDNGKDPDAEDLHRITGLNKLEVDSMPVEDLEPLNELFLLDELVLSRTSISDITLLEKHPGLKRLTINESPVIDFSVLDYLEELVFLDLSYTAISDISVLSELRQLRVLHLSGTKIRNIKPMEDLMNLKQLDISNTRVRSLKQLEANFNMEVLVCYNTRINAGRIEDFRAIHTNCKVMYY